MKFDFRYGCLVSRPQVDIWSAAVMLYELLHGFPTFGQNNQDEVHRKILAAEPQFHPHIRKLSDEAKDFLACCFQRQPSGRSSTTHLVTHDWLQSNSTRRTRRLQAQRSMHNLTAVAPETADRDAEYVPPWSADSSSSAVEASDASATSCFSAEQSGDSAMSAGKRARKPLLSSHSFGNLGLHRAPASDPNAKPRDGPPSTQAAASLTLATAPPHLPKETPSPSSKSPKSKHLHVGFQPSSAAVVQFCDDKPATSVMSAQGSGSGGRKSAPPRLDVPDSNTVFDMPDSDTSSRDIHMPSLQPTQSRSRPARASDGTDDGERARRISRAQSFGTYLPRSRASADDDSGSLLAPVQPRGSRSWFDAPSYRPKRDTAALHASGSRSSLDSGSGRQQHLHAAALSPQLAPNPPGSMRHPRGSAHADLGASGQDRTLAGPGGGRTSFDLMDDGRLHADKELAPLSRQALLRQHTSSRKPRMSADDVSYERQSSWRAGTGSSMAMRHSLSTMASRHDPSAASSGRLELPALTPALQVAPKPRPPSQTEFR
eukprot:jgi/Tetstr1/441449/TSEL_029694.t1